MKFTTLTLLVLVIAIELSPTLIRATMVEGPTGDQKVTCNVLDVMIPCLLPLTNKLIMPTPHCCQVMREHETCLCQFIKGGEWWSQALFNSPNGQKTCKACNIPYPKC
ncbi:LOW QUALITY PROTEIN: non-specific lipid-transfer protein 2 [Arabidopsis lyrata subsp. lyrata]|uniref:LOW QUALITY PROTEIN: non-specific lipid-transfer protein 2 n=1 Tax=Arabidopsis lyrata subsp. lyrata TaxID=81972 RepID=UPI000A29DDC7|nr:LOW QUALITY PROTEIN: non-specific lipid-transfer protein 2 [Arabidopsis lyrata subsp. lyrata]|eukprot:XP_020882043.1 LOW QUALITY PROTEIN: non-specific lipid-transfer protein 2 [Arabidopsis lyrata subsp. lyrata]